MILPGAAQRRPAHSGRPRRSAPARRAARPRCAQWSGARLRGPFSRMGGISARPTQTAVAPSASALSACTPSVIEPSTSTGYPGPTCARISGRTISAGTDVGTSPWWCETTMPPTPACLHSAASCGVQHAFDKERQAGGRAVPRNVVPVLGAHRLAEHDVVLAVAVKNMVDVHADRHRAQLFGLAQLGPSPCPRPQKV